MICSPKAGVSRRVTEENTVEREQFGYIKARDGSPVYAAYHAPAQAEAACPILICPPLFEERKSAYAALRKLALRLALAGHAVMRFDYRGSGESGGSSATRRWVHLAEDAAEARETLARLSGRKEAVLLGLRLGATLALQEAAGAGAMAVAALAPILSGAAQVRQWKMRSKIRAELTDRTARGSQVDAEHGQDARATLDFDGYEVHPGFFEDVTALDLVKAPPALRVPALVVQISHRVEPSNESKQFVSALGQKAKLACLRLEPFWDKLDDVDTAEVENIVGQWIAGL